MRLASSLFRLSPVAIKPEFSWRDEVEDCSLCCGKIFWAKAEKKKEKESMNMQ
jgi:hypothetical protein